MLLQKASCTTTPQTLDSPARSKRTLHLDTPRHVPALAKVRAVLDGSLGVRKVLDVHRDGALERGSRDGRRLARVRADFLQLGGRGPGEDA